MASLERISARSFLRPSSSSNAAGQNDVVAVAVHLDDAGLDLGAQVHIQILDATKVDQGSRQEAAQADIEDEAALDDFDNLAGNNLAGLELLFDLNPGALVLGTLLGQDQTTVFIFLLQDEGLDFVAESNDIGRIRHPCGWRARGKE